MVSGSQTESDGPELGEGVPSSHHTVQTALDWLREKLEDTQYGECGVTFELRAGRVVRIKRHEETLHKIPPGQGG